MIESQFASHYKQALANFIDSTSEAALEEAYEIGRKALRQGLSLGEIGELHYCATHDLISDQRVALATLGLSEKFFLEMAVIYDMALRGYRETIARLQVEIEERQRIEEKLRDTAAELSRERDLLEQRVTERTNALRLQAEQLKHTNDELRHSNRDLDDFAHIASHDLKEPLRGISNHASFLLEDYGERFDEQAKHRLNRLTELSRRMTQLITDLLQYSRFGRADQLTKAVDLQGVIREIQIILVDALEMHNARIIVTEPLPMVQGNRAELTALFQNLITNAMKYNEAGEKIVEIGIAPSTGQAGDAAFEVLYVRDNGIGIEDQFHDHIFRIFKRLHGEKAYGGGTGAGLTFVRKIVENQGGRIWLTSRLGEGTTFYFTLMRPA